VTARADAWQRNDVITVSMASLVMLGSGIQMPAVRPLFGDFLHFSESTMHAFMSLNMLGAVLGAPPIAALVDRRRWHRRACVVLGFLDAALLGSCTISTSAATLLALRVAQGATNVALLSIVLGSLSRDRSVARAHGRAVGLAGGGAMLALAVGPAIGGPLLAIGPHAPFRAAALMAFLVSVTALGVPSWLSSSPRSVVAAAPEDPRRFGELTRNPLMLVPLVLGATERFTVGCFVVTFSLYAHAVRHLSDATVALHYSLFLVPFALATFPLVRLGERYSRTLLMKAGAFLYGAAFLTFGWASGGALVLALVGAGVASAMVYGPSLCCVIAAGRGSERATAMALFHAAGCGGMLLGPAAAGLISFAVGALGAPMSTKYLAVFTFAGSVQLLLLRLLRAPLATLRRLETSSAFIAAGRTDVEEDGASVGWTASPPTIERQVP